MRRLGLCAMVALFVLGGCTPGGDPVPSGTVDPVVESITPTPSPTPTWTGEEQAAIDAVQRYLEVWTRISQNLEAADWNDLWTVADELAISDSFEIWTGWRMKGYYLVGSPSFTPDGVIAGMIDYARGNTYTVRGCYSIAGSTLVGPSGQPTGQRGLESSLALYQVFIATDGRSVVTKSSGMTEPC